MTLRIGCVNQAGIGREGQNDLRLGAGRVVDDIPNSRFHRTPFRTAGRDIRGPENATVGRYSSDRHDQSNCLILVDHRRRVVLYDTLLEESGPEEVRVVTAHELAHRRERHVAKGTALGAAAAAAFVLILWGLLSWPTLLAALDASGANDPRIAPFVLLVARGLSLLTLPLGAALSRSWEREADRISLTLTDDLAAFESIHRRLARSNLADLYPPRAMYVLLFSHPSAPERLAAARRAAAPA